jgi:hypothetical protein
MDVENDDVLYNNNNNKNILAKLRFFEAMDQGTIEVMDTTVEESTCEEGGAKEAAPPNTRPEETSNLKSAPRSAGGRGEGKVGTLMGVVMENDTPICIVVEENTREKGVAKGTAPRITYQRNPQPLGRHGAQTQGAKGRQGHARGARV